MKNILKIAVLLLIISCSIDTKSGRKLVDKEASKKVNIHRTNNCDTNLLPKHFVEPQKINDSVVFIEQIGNYFEYQNVKTDRIYITDNKKKVLLKDLKYFSRISGGFQVLNEDNEIVYYNLDLQKLSKEPEPESLFSCGNVSGWKLVIEKNRDYYHVKKKEGFSGNFDDKWQILDSIAGKNVKDIYFLNNTKKLSYDENGLVQETIIIAYEDCFGIRIQGKTYYFDTIDTSSAIKVGCNNLFGYFQITEIKYKKLYAFEQDLAAFELENGNKGYVDRYGNEYYD